jgi:acyl dehydratase
MGKRTFEDFAVGSVVEYGPRVVTRGEIIDFARQFDPQPMHLDDDAGRNSMLGGLSASGWHTCALAMRLIAEGIFNDSEAMGSPGIDEVRWMLPLRPNDSITLRATVLDMRTSRSRPQIGFIAYRFELLNQDRAIIMQMDFTVMMGRRQAAATA